MGVGAGVPAVRARAAGDGWKRLALWVLIVGLPLGDELSSHLQGPGEYYGGNAAYWFSGLQVDLVLMGVAAAAVGVALWRSGEGLASIGWPARPRPVLTALFALTVLGALALALYYHPAPVSIQVYGVPASTPVTPLERLSLVGMALADAVVQETVWRGAVIAWLRGSLGLPGAVALSLASYLFFHPTAGWSWGEIALRLPIACVYTALALWRKNIGACSYLHFVLAAGQLLAPGAS